MKKIIFIFLGLITTVLISCNSNQNASKENTVQEEKKLSASEQKKLNIYFSNFAEAMLESFNEREEIKNDELIRFGIMFNYINNRKKFENIDEYNVKIKKETIEETAQRFFEKSIKNHKSVEGVGYNNGYYSLPLADGEAYTFAQVDNFTELEDSKYAATLSVYTAGSGWTGDAHANPSTWNNEDKPTIAYKVNAKVIKKDANYILIEYIKEAI